MFRLYGGQKYGNLYWLGKLRKPNRGIDKSQKNSIVSETFIAVLIWLGQQFLNLFLGMGGTTVSGSFGCFTFFIGLDWMNSSRSRKLKKAFTPRQ